LNKLTIKNPEKKNEANTRRTLILYNNPVLKPVKLKVDEKTLDEKPVGPTCSIRPLSNDKKVVK